MKYYQTVFKTILILLLFTFCFTWDLNPTLTAEFTPGKVTGDFFPSTAVLSNGNFVTTWSSKTSSSNYNIYFSSFDSTGKILKGPVKVSTTTDVNVRPTIAPDTSGGFTIFWNRRDADSLSNLNDLNVQYYDSTFTGGTILKANTIIDNPNSSSLDAYGGFSGKYFFACFQLNANPYSGYRMFLQLMDRTGNNLTTKGSTTMVGQDAGANNLTCSSLSLGNGNVIVVWHCDQAGDYDMYYAIVKEIDYSYVKNVTKINTRTSGIQADGSTALLANGNIIVAWMDAFTDIYTQILAADGTPVGSNFKVNTTSGSTKPRTASLGTDGFIIAYYNSPSTIFYQLYAIDGTKIGTERKIPTTATGTIDENFNIVYDNNNNLLPFSYSLNNVNYVQFWYKDINACKDITVTVGVINKTQIVLNLTTNSWLIIKTAPTNGTLTTNAGASLTTGKLYNSSDVYFNFTPSTFKTSGIFTFSTNLNDSSCKVTITPCYVSCGSCPILGDSTNHQCSTCDSTNVRGGGNYYPLIDKASMCYKVGDTIPAAYSLANNIWTKCYQTCRFCTGYTTDPSTDMMCNPNSCIKDYYPSSDKITSCFTGALSGYYFDGSLYQPCYSSCGACSAQGSSTNNKCTKCKSGYFPTIDNMTNCYTGTLIGYYLNGNVYQQCYLNCYSCTTGGSSTDHQCTKCKTGYYQVENSSSCYKSDENLIGYFFDTLSATFKQCYKSCGSCYDDGTSEHHNCITCLSGYYPLINQTSKCYQQTDSVDGYYFDTNIFKQCYTSCLTCNSNGDIKNPNCLTCAPNQICDPCTKIIYKDACIESCSSITKYDPINNTCISCDIVFNNNCVTMCPDGYIIKDTTCILCSTLNQFYYNGQCVKVCPTNTIAVNNICQAKPNTTNNLVTGCTSDTCKNGGICQVSFGKINCTCAQGFIGTYCEYSSDKFSISQVLGIY
jgi:hypothetical protein